MQKAILSKVTALMLSGIVLISCLPIQISASDMQNEAQYYAIKDEVDLFISDTSVMETDNTNSFGENSVMAQESILGAIATPEDGNRYTVLLLDNSGSMEGTPLYTEKAAAKKFCEQMLAADGVNYISIITFSSYIKQSNDFTDQLSVLENQLNSMSAGGGTDTNAALELAISILNTVPETATKNIVLLSDGLPENGNFIANGRYNSNDTNLYGYGNAVYQTAKSIDSSWNLYTLGFFHALEGYMLEYAKRIMADLPANENMYYEVTDVNDLEFMFGKIADNITQSDLKKLYIEQHISYINDIQYKNDIIPEYGQCLSQILLDVREDIEVKNYNYRKNLSDTLGFSLTPSQEYELLLANLMVNDQNYNGIKDAYLSNFQESLNDTLDFITDSINVFGKVIKESDKKEMVRLFNQMMKEPFLSDKYCQLHSEYSDIVNEYYSVGEMNDLLEKFGVALEIADVAFSTASETYEYYCFAKAYIDTTDDLTQVLRNLHAITIENAWAANIQGIEPLDQLFESIYGLQMAIENFIHYMETYKKDHTSALADFAREKLVSRTGSKVADKVTDLMFSKIPIFNVVPILKKGLDISIILSDILTDVDDRAASGNMVEKLYIITALMDEVVDNLASDLLSDYNSGKSDETLFRRASAFDESVNIYKTTLLLAADYGEEYEKTLLKSESAKPIADIKKVSWYSTAITLANVDKLMTGNILCHHEGLIYNHKSDIALNTERLKVFVIACPVDVDVLDDQGIRVAHLSDRNKAVEDEYAPYFYTIDNSNNDVLKVVALPDESKFQILLSGTGKGKMDVYLGAYDGTAIYDTKKYSGIKVEANDQGYLPVDEENGFRRLIFNNTEYSEADIQVELTVTPSGQEPTVTPGEQDETVTPGEESTTTPVVTPDTTPQTTSGTTPRTSPRVSPSSGFGTPSSTTGGRTGTNTRSVTGSTGKTTSRTVTQVVTGAAAKADNTTDDIRKGSGETTQPRPNTVKTGDDSDPFIAFVMMMASAACILYLFTLRKIKK